ncbi:MAG TPA: DinB family protein [Chitinophagaceae bacterium]|nr:DinB family protein [Chitinophagaceae bacterium]
MKELLKLLAAYNLWANQKTCDAILSLPDEQQLQDLPSSFRSLHRTVLHMWDAESIWWQRMKLQEKIVIPSETFQGNMRDAVTGLLQQDQQWLEWIGNASEAALDHVFQYYNLKKEHFRQPVFQVATHVFNHNTYHRGQLVNMMRQLGVEKIPQTDLVVWARKK